MNIMNIMWDIEREVTPTELIDLVEKEYGKIWAKQTMTTILGRMLKKEVLVVRKEGRNSYYRPITVEEYKQREANEILKKYKGSIKNFLTALYQDKNKINKKDIDEIKDWFLNE